MDATLRKTLDQTAARGGMQLTDLIPVLPTGAATMLHNTAADLVALALANGAAKTDLSNVDPPTGRAALGVAPAGQLLLTLATPVDGGKYGDRVEIANPTGHVGYGARFTSYVQTGNVNTGGNSITTTTITQFSSIQNGSAWGAWDVLVGPLAVGSGYTGAPGVAQSYAMVTREVNPVMRGGDPGQQPENRLWGNMVGGDQYIPETQDFSALLGNARVGYNVTFAQAFNHSPFAANVAGHPEHARFYNVRIVNPNTIAPGGYVDYATGHRSFLKTVTLSAAGSGYSANDILVLNTGLDQNFSENGKIKVLTVNGLGAITGYEIYVAGSYAAGFASPIGVTGGTGTGASFTYTLSSTADYAAAYLGLGGQWPWAFDFWVSATRQASFTQGWARVPNNTPLKGRNAAGAADLPIINLNASDQVEVGGLAQIPAVAWVPTLSADSGAFTSIAIVDARYSVSNKRCHFTLNVHITTKGTAAGALRFTEPVAASGNALSYYIGGMNATTGAALAGRGTAGVIRCALYNGSDPLADATFYVLSGSYEIA